MSFKFVRENSILMMEPTQEVLEKYAVKVSEKYKNSNLMIATAESCTGGMLAKFLTDIPGSSKFYECGVVSYSSRIKSKILGVNPNTIDEYNVVSAQVAAEMAQCIMSRADSDVGIGITGVAGPGPDGDIDEGTIYIALATKKSVYVASLNTKMQNCRDYNRRLAVLNALNLLNMCIDGSLE